MIYAISIYLIYGFGHVYIKLSASIHKNDLCSRYSCNIYDNASIELNIPYAIYLYIEPYTLFGFKSVMEIVKFSHVLHITYKF